MERERGLGAWSPRGPRPSVPDAPRPGRDRSGWLTVVACTCTPARPILEGGEVLWADPRAAGEASRWEDRVGNTRCNQTPVSSARGRKFSCVCPACWPWTQADGLRVCGVCARRPT